METTWIIGGLILGIGSSLHCIGMCGPLTLLVPFGESQLKRDLHFMIYLFSKAIGYGMLGLLFSIAGSSASFIIGQKVMSFLSGLLILMLLVFNFYKFNFFPIRTVSHHVSKLINTLKSAGAWHHYIALGIFNSVLPCGMVLVAAAASLASPDIVHGFMFMFVFGLGTIPALLFVKKMQRILSSKSKTNLKHAASVVGVLLSGLLIFRSFASHTPHNHPSDETSICKPIRTQ